MTKPSSVPVVAARGLGRRFGRHWALAHVDLDLGQGESLLLVGSNGSGKTTLLRLLCGLLRRSRGDLRVFGTDPSSGARSVRVRTTLISHRSFLYEQLSPIEHLNLWTGLRRGSSTGTTRELLDSVGLTDRGDDPVGTFSTGMRKRLTLLRARVEQPDLVLLDEPFSSLDPSGQDLIGEWLRELTSTGTTLIIASHSLERAKTLCTRAIVLNHGQVSWRGPAAAVEPGLLTSAGLGPLSSERIHP